VSGFVTRSATGGGVLFAVNVTMTLQPHLFGWQMRRGRAGVVRNGGVWWFVFALPCAFNVRERHLTPAVPPAEPYAGMRELARRCRAAPLPHIVMFLAAYWSTSTREHVIKMAVDYGLSLGFDSSNSCGAAADAVRGVPARLPSAGWAGVSAAPGIFLALSVYVAAPATHTSSSACRILRAGGGRRSRAGRIQSLSRSYFGGWCGGKSSEFFGFYNMMVSRCRPGPCSRASSRT